MVKINIAILFSYICNIIRIMTLGRLWVKYDHVAKLEMKYKTWITIFLIDMKRQKLISKYIIKTTTKKF